MALSGFYGSKPELVSNSSHSWSGTFAVGHVSSPQCKKMIENFIEMHLLEAPFCTGVKELALLQLAGSRVQLSALRGAHLRELCLLGSLPLSVHHPHSFRQMWCVLQPLLKCSVVWQCAAVRSAARPASTGCISVTDDIFLVYA